MHRIPPDDGVRGLSWLTRRVADDERRENNRIREGRICELDEGKGLYRVRLREATGDDPEYLSPWLPVRTQSSGFGDSYRVQAEPVMDQPVTVYSESGDLTDAIIELSAFSDDNPRPHDKAGEFRERVAGYDRTLDKEGNESVKAANKKYEAEHIHEKAEEIVLEGVIVIRGPIRFELGGGKAEFIGGKIEAETVDAESVFADRIEERD